MESLYVIGLGAWSGLLQAPSHLRFFRFTFLLPLPLILRISAQSGADCGLKSNSNDRSFA